MSVLIPRSPSQQVSLKCGLNSHNPSQATRLSLVFFVLESSLHLLSKIIVTISVNVTVSTFLL